jgi:hypothetical protein
MVALIFLCLNLGTSLFKSKSRLEAENAARRRQLIILQRKLRGRVQFTNSDRLFLIQPYRWCPSVLKASARSTPAIASVGLPRSGISSASSGAFVGAQSMGGNGLIVSFGEVGEVGEVMPMRLGRLQRQSRRAFWASAAPEVSTSELAGWCWARQTLMEKRAPSRWQRESMIRAARSIGAVRTRRIGREWLWRLPDAVARWR